MPKSEEEINNPDYIPRSRRWKAKHVMGRASKYLKQQRYEEAAVFYSKAIQREPDLPEVYNNKGYCMLMNALRANEIQPTIELFTKALELKPKYAHALYNRGVARHKLAAAKLLECGEKSTEETDKLIKFALEDFDGCIAADRFFSKAYHNRAVCQSLLRDTKRATGNLTRAILITDEESILHKCHKTGAYLPLEERSNLLDGENSKGALDEDSSLLISEGGSSLASGSKVSVDADMTRMKASKGAKMGSAADCDNNLESDSTLIPDVDEKQKNDIIAWQKERAYQIMRKALHSKVARDVDLCRKDCYKSLKSRQLLYERRVEVDASESDRAKMDIFKMEMGIGVYSDEEEQEEISQPGSIAVSPNSKGRHQEETSGKELSGGGNGNMNRSTARKGKRTTQANKTVGKKGSILQSRRKR